MFFHNFGDGN